MKYIDRDISWLSFNERILQEAGNSRVPLMERLKFAAIFSSNLEEFYKVRVASHRFAQKYRGDKKNKFGYRPSYILQQINLIVSDQQERLGRIFDGEIVPALRNEGLYLLKDDLTATDRLLISEYFERKLDGNYTLIDITGADRLELKNQYVYLYFVTDERSYVLELDYKRFGRFITLSDEPGQKRIVQLDDLFKLNAEKILDTEAEVFAVKISRDAELYIDEEQDEDIVRKIQKSIRKRDSGMPARLLFDENISFKFINALRKKIAVDMSGLVPGGRYHNFYDFFGFPSPDHKPELFYEKIEKVPSPRLETATDWFEAISQKDVFLSFPYQSYDYIAEFLNRVADDDQVKEINITLYRVARESAICQALERAVQKGKKVFVVSEVQARFDEESNIYWGERLRKAGAIVSYGVEGLKIHAKIFTVHREEAGGKKVYSYLGTGNFNEKTAGIYGDHAVLSARKSYADDLELVFDFLGGSSLEPTFGSLLVATYNLRKELNRQIKNEIRMVKKGKVGRIQVKLNSLEDLDMIDRIREAADAGVKIDMVVRGICCYTPLSKAQAENIKVVSIVDQFLEHARIYHFHNDGNTKTYLASADWMTRNLSRRIEVAFPILDPVVEAFLVKQIHIQLNDRVKGRLVAVPNENSFVDGGQDLDPIGSGIKTEEQTARSAQNLMFDLVREMNPPLEVVEPSAS